MKSCIVYGLIILFFYNLVGCKKSAQEKSVTINQITGDYDSLIYNVEIKGDTNAYDELFYGFIDSNEAERTDSVLCYSRIMAQNFKYERAYYDYLKAFCEKNKIENNWNTLSELDLTKLNKTSKAMAIAWLNQMLQDKIITQEEFNSVRK